MLEQEVIIEIEGLGIIMYSNFAVSGIDIGEDYLSDHYWNSEDVAKHIKEGSIIGFCTSSPGTYILKFRNGYPTDGDILASEFRLRLGLEVRDERIYIDDLYALSEWENNCPNYIELKNGFYHLTLIGNRPSSNITGDNQIIYCYMNNMENMPELNHLGVPVFC